MIEGMAVNSIVEVTVDTISLGEMSCVNYSKTSFDVSTYVS